MIGRRFAAACGLLLAAACAPPRASAPAAPAVGPGLARGLAEADSLVRDAVGRLTPGAVLVVSRDGAVVHERAYGHAQLRDVDGRPLASPPTMRTTTLFDLASVTKVVGTTWALMLLADRGQLDVDAPVHRYLPDFRGPKLDSITVRHLLQHASGLVQWQPMYYHASNAAGVHQTIRAMPLGWGVGAERRYSDLGFMLLGYIVERASGRPLDRFLEQELYAPLGLRRTAFNPKARGFTEFAATEQGNAYERQMVHDPNFGYDYAGDPTAWDRWRRYVLAGETNDGNAFYAHGGVAGHAGLFSTGSEVRVLLDLVVAGGTSGGRRYVTPPTIARFLTRDRYGHYLGWQYPADMPDGSFSHTGFTGTYVMGVPRYGLSVVLLTNRQNLGRNERGFFPDIGPLQRGVSRAVVGGARGDAGG